MKYVSILFGLSVIGCWVAACWTTGQAQESWTATGFILIIPTFLIHQ